MKKFLSIVFVGLLFLTACNTEYSSLSSLNSNTESFETNNTENIEAAETDNDKGSLISFNNNEDIENFINYGMCNVNGWIYYSINRQLRKCTLDLTDDTLLERNIYKFYIQNSMLYFYRYTENNETEVYRANLDDKELYAEKIAELEYANDLMIYKNYIIYRDSGKSYNELAKYDINSGIIKENIISKVAHFSVVDHFIYYDLYDDNTIYRYDLNTGKSEAFFEFEIQDDFQPKVYYINRMIIIQTDVNKFIYTSIDDIKLINVLFDISEYEKGWALFHFNDSDNLYFSIAEHYDVANPTTTPRSIYKVKIGTEKSDLVKIITGDNIGFLINGYRYFFDFDDNIFREKLT